MAAELTPEVRDAITRGVLEAVPAGVVYVAADGAIGAANAEALRVLGLGYDELTGRYTVDFETETVYEDGTVCPAAEYPVTRAVVTGEPQPGVTLGVRRPDGRTSWAVFRAVPIADPETKQVRGALVTFLDITERKWAETERAALEQQLRQAQKMDSVGQLAGGIAHDFNNLLQIILGNAEMSSDVGDVSKRLESIRRAAQRAADLTSQLLSFARQRSLALENVEASELVEGTLSLLGPVMGKEIRLRADPGKGVGCVRVDRNLIEQALINLCINARDAMPGGGGITLSTRVVRVGDAFRARHSWATGPVYVAIDVTDTGEGFEDDVRDRMFEPFFTTKAPGRGTGLGLSVVFGVLQQHGGGVEAASRAGEGARFSIFLPRVETGSSRDAHDSVAPPVGCNETILVVDDEQQVRELAVRVLQANGYGVIAASSGEAALAALEEEPQRVALMLLDVVMPGMRGPEVLRRARRIRAGLPVLYTTGHDLDLVPDTDLAQEPVLAKPYGTASLLREVRRIVDG